jgi:hypothetical protein
MVNTFAVCVFKYLNNVSVWWNALGTTSLAIAVLVAAPKHESDKFVLRTFIDGTGVGWSKRASATHIAVIRILLAQYTFLILSFAFFNSRLRDEVASPTGEPVTRIFLDMVRKKSAIVLMVSNVS